MVRATNAVASHKRRKRIMKQAKGFWGDRKNHLRLTQDAVAKALADNYRHRKLRKREFRSIWIQRLSVAAKLNGISYCTLIDGLKKAGSLLDRKSLSELAIHDSAAFTAVVNHIKPHLSFS
jgi:large subunit ribosomal protein L20